MLLIWRLVPGGEVSEGERQGRMLRRGGMSVLRGGGGGGACRVYTQAEDQHFSKGGIKPLCDCWSCARGARSEDRAH